MIHFKQFDNGLRLIINKMNGFVSASAGILVKTGSANESETENGISHYIEHVMFKGTQKRSAFEISDHIDRIGAQINAFTSKEMTCYYTKSTGEHLENSLEVLSDIFFNSVFDKKELEKEKGVVIEEINMSEDTPEELCLDLLAQSYYGKSGLGQTILGPAKNIRRFTREDVLDYMDKYYTADNVVIALAGDIDVERAEKFVEENFASKFKTKNSASQIKTELCERKFLYKSKPIEQTHLGFAMKGFSMHDEMSDAFAIANTILGGGMSSRLFQKIREELGLAYSVYSYSSQYKDNGVLEIYAGVNTAQRDLAVEAIVEEVKRFKREGITEQEFLRGKEQMKSAFILGRESTASQMMLYGKYLLYLDKQFDVKERLKKIDKISLKDVLSAIEQSFDIEKASTASVGSKRSAVKI
ncbi:MAG: insulinase family protein [Clostridia bacterium]|nr:insulinase family protein [Clostridia bacterium]